MNFRTRLLSILSMHMSCVDTFTLQQVYQVAEGPLSYHYPNNNTIDSSIRQNLQKLEEEGYLNFVDESGNKVLRSEGNGVYAWV
jgi:hypothetical protein